jgi:cupin superfamily acireductone dioxygenase involved in methionine salvage
VGSITFHVSDKSGDVHDIELEPGDRVELGHGIVHSASVGPNGVICVDGAREVT